jgi:hypothetical protein
MDGRFRRPGTVQKSAFGVQFDLDRERKEEPPPPPADLTSSRLHTSLPISRKRAEFLYLVRLTLLKRYGHL